MDYNNNNKSVYRDRKNRIFAIYTDQFFFLTFFSEVFFSELVSENATIFIVQTTISIGF